MLGGGVGTGLKGFGVLCNGFLLQYLGLFRGFWLTTFDSLYMCFSIYSSHLFPDDDSSYSDVAG